jgi:hypothetical protein
MIDQTSPTITREILHFTVEGIIESIDAQSFPEGSAKLGIKYREGGYSIVVVPLAFACAMSLGAPVSLTVVAS